MKKQSQRAAIVVASALGALVLALPGRSSADPYRYSNYRWGSADPYTQAYYGDDYNRSYDNGQGWRDWRGIQREREEIEQGRADRRRAADRRLEARRKMEQARRAGDWDAYWHYHHKAEQAWNAQQRYHEQIARDKRELRQAWRGDRHDYYD